MNEEAAEYVFDSFALLAYLEGEKGAERVAALLSQAQTRQNPVWMSIINLGEVLYIIEREQGALASRKALAATEQLPIALVDANRPLTLSAAHIKAHFPLSYADTFAVALGRHKNARVVTGDPEFGQVESLVSIEWLSR